MDGSQRGDIEQIVFGWSDTNLTGQGFGPLESSAADSTLEYWSQRLRERVRTPGPDRPQTSLCYVADTAHAAVLRRSRGGQGDTRKDICHALIGSAEQLNARIGILLSSWPGWQTPRDRAGSAPLQPLDFYLLYGEIALNEQHFTVLAGEHGTALVPLLAAVLRAPGAPLTVVADDNDQAVPLMWGLTEIMHHLGRGTAAPPVSGWTFSTYESGQSLERAGLPRIVFTTRQQQGYSGYSGSERNTVSLHGQPPEDQALAVARLAIDEYAAGGVGRLTAWLAGSGALNAVDLRDRIGLLADDRVYAAAGSVAPPAGGHRAEPRPSPTPPRIETPTPPRMDAPPPRPGGNGAGGVRPPIDPRELTWVELIGAFGRADSGEQLRALRVHACRRRPMTEPGERAKAGQLLLENDFWVRHLNDRIPLGEVRETVKALFHFAFGQQLAEERIAWPLLSHEKLPEQVVHAVAEYAAEHNQYTQLLPWLGVRWMRERGYPVADPPEQEYSRAVARRKKGIWRPAAVRDAFVEGDAGRISAYAGVFVVVLLALWVVLAWVL